MTRECVSRGGWSGSRETIMDLQCSHRLGITLQDDLLKAGGESANIRHALIYGGNLEVKLAVHPRIIGKPPPDRRTSVRAGSDIEGPDLLGAWV